MSDTLKALKHEFGEAILETVEFRGEETAIIAKVQALSVFEFCRDKLEFDYLIDISSLDLLGQEPRWEMVYELCTLGNGANQHLRIKFKVEEDEKVESVTSLWPTAGWHEREVYDMMGIEFEALADHRRILMWEGYPHFPLRKDFPLAGRPTDLPDVAFTEKAPLEGGPFVTSPTAASTTHREPRSRDFD
ncbi:MAG: NADH-quinone oxidoreductase subunit C [Verrucomicrobiota bacterium]